MFDDIDINALEKHEPDEINPAVVEYFILRSMYEALNCMKSTATNAERLDEINKDMKKIENMMND